MKGLRTAVRAVAAVLSLILVLSGCGGGGGGGGGGFAPAASSPATPPTGPVTTPPAGPVTGIASPKDLRYTRAAVIYSHGAAIASNNPAHSGGAIDRYDISPALPLGWRSTRQAASSAARRRRSSRRPASPSRAAMQPGLLLQRCPSRW